MNTIHVNEIGFTFHKIGRALDEPYYLYKPRAKSAGCIVVIDKHGYMFNFNPGLGWESAGPYGNHRKLLDESIAAGQSKLIIFDEEKVDNTVLIVIATRDYTNNLTPEEFNLKGEKATARFREILESRMPAPVDKLKHLVIDPGLTWDRISELMGAYPASMICIYREASLSKMPNFKEKLIRTAIKQFYPNQSVHLLDEYDSIFDSDEEMNKYMANLIESHQLNIKKPFLKIVRAK